MADGGNMATAEHHRRPSLKDVALTTAGGAALTVAGGLAANAAGLGPFHSDNTPKGVTQNQPGGMPSANVPLTDARETPTAAAPTATPTETSTPEAEIPCFIVLEQYCKDADVIELPGGFTLIGLNPHVNARVNAPVSGHATKEVLSSTSKYKWSSVRIGDPDVLSPKVPTFILRGDLKFPDMDPLDPNQQDQVGTIGDTGVSNLGYRLLIEVSTPAQNPNNLPTPRETLRKYFPWAFKRPAKQASLDNQQTPPDKYLGAAYQN